MNKYKFIDHLHHPDRVNQEQQQELEELIDEFPYFQTARTLLAKIKNNKDPKTARSIINSAAVYVFDRKYLKKYLDSQLFFIETKEEEAQRKELASKHPEKPKSPPTTPKQETPIAPNQAEKSKVEKKGAIGETSKKTTSNQPAERPTSTPGQQKPATQKQAEQKKVVEKSKKKQVSSPTPPPGTSKKETSTAPPDASLEALTPSSSSDLDKLIEEVFQDMANLRKSKARFQAWQDKNDMEEAVEKAVSAARDKTSDTEKDPKTTSEEATSKSEITDSPEKEKGNLVEAIEPKVDNKVSEEAPEKKEEVTDSVEEKPKVTSTAKESDIEKKEEEKPQESEIDDKNIRLQSSSDAPLDSDQSESTDSPLKASIKTFEEEEIKKPTSKDQAKKSTSAAKTTTTKKSAAVKKTSTKKATSTKAKSTAKKTTSKTTKSSTAAKKKTTVKKTTTPKAESKTKAASKAKNEKPESKSEIEVSETKKTPASKKSTSTKDTPPKEDKDQIINEFIEKEPSISKPDSAAIKKGDMSEGSTRFHADIASEYLAEIYIEQGKESRAIEIYENLILKFPEKKSYFAGLIEKLKKK